jgi:excisionase family DNA binding protein
MRGPTLIDAAEVAELLNEPVTTVYRLAREGLIPHVRVGRLVRFSPVMLGDWIRSGGTPLAGTRRDGEAA